MAKTDIKKCPFVNCPFPDHELDISVDAYAYNGANRRYYHPQCLEEERKLREKNEQEKADLALFLDLWTKHISRTVNYGMLRKILNEYMDRGIGTNYLLFCLQYVISNRMSLNYPNGFRYYIDRQEIKSAYEKKQLQEQLDELKKQSSVPVGTSNAPQFALAKQKSMGFDQILNR